MFWSFEMTQLLARDRLGQMLREAERERLAKQAATGRSRDRAPRELQSSIGPAEVLPPLWPRDRLTLGLRHTHPLRSLAHAVLPGRGSPEGTARQGDGGEE